MLLLWYLKNSRPFVIKTDCVHHAQAFGCWGYVQLPSGFAIFLGSKMPFGFRVVWLEGLKPKFSFGRHDLANRCVDHPRYRCMRFT